VAYPEEVLAEGEELVLHKHPHWKMLVLPVLSLVLVVAVASFLAALARAQSWAHAAWIALAVLAVVAVLRLTVGPVLRWRTTHFVLTDRRVLVREGLFTRTGIDIPVTRINSVQFRHGLVDRMLGTGTLVIESASDEPLEFDDVPQVERVHALLYNEVFDASQEAGRSVRHEPHPDGVPLPEHRGRGWRR
jgi:uncharacterized membrane protein YdbT with pleckstrin-like domain